MDSLVSIGISLVVIFALLNVVLLVVVISRLVRMTLQPPHTGIMPREQLPASHRLVFDCAFTDLDAIGFKRTITRHSRPFILGGSENYSYCDCYYHPVLDVHAEVFPAISPSKRWPYSVYLWNWYKDGSALLTVNGMAHLLIPYPKSVTVVDAYSPDLSGQLDAHVKARQGFTAEPYDAFLAPRISMQIAERLLPKLEREGHFYVRAEQAGSPLYGVRLKAAMKMAWRMRTGAGKLAKVEAEPVAGSPDRRPAERSDAVQQAAEQIAFVGSLATLNGLKAPDWFRRMVFIVSAMLFLAVGSYFWGALGALLIAAVIAFHEAGHWMAMRLSHFRDVQVFFVPGMGGATSGEKHEANPLTHLLVYLAGPLPGVIIGLVALTWLSLSGLSADAALFRPVALVAVALLLINGFNLLPVTPLDGGRVVDLFVLGRLPWLRFVFALLSAVAFLGLGIATEDAILRGLGIVLLIGLPHHYRMAKGESALRAAGLAGAGVDIGFIAAAERLHALLSASQYSRWNFQTKTVVGQALLPRLLGRFPTARETAVALGIYVAALVLPVVVMIGLFFAAPTQTLSALAVGSIGAKAPPDTEETRLMMAELDNQRLGKQKEWEAKVAAAPTAEMKWNLVFPRAQLSHETEDYEQAKRNAALALQISRSFAAPDVRFVESAELVLRQDDTQDTTGRSALLDEAEDTARKLTPTGEPRPQMALASILDQRIASLYTPEGTHAEKQLALAEESLELRIAAGATQSMLMESRTQIANAALAVRDLARAESMFRENNSKTEVRDAGEDASTFEWRRLAASMAYARFLIDQNRGTEAMKLCAPARQPLQAAQFQLSECAAYLHLTSGQPGEALKVVNEFIAGEAKAQAEQDLAQRVLLKALNLGDHTPQGLLIVGREAALAAGDTAALAQIEERLKSRDGTAARRDWHCRQTFLPEPGHGRRMRQDIQSWQKRWRPCPAKPAN